MNALKCFQFAVLMICLTICGIYTFGQDIPLTKAEATHYKATSRYSDVLEFISKLQQQSGRLRVESLCTTTEGRDLPLIVIGEPVPSSPLDLNFDDRMVVYIQANIHAGEVEGKEASLMLARDLCLNPDPDYLDKLVILLAPIFNADGNERISPDNRRNQVGPEQGVGVRYNGQNLDLNRDGMKLESPEVQGLVRNVMLRWDPAVLIDSHTHNGSYHEEVATYIWSLNPNADTRLIDYMSDTFMSGVNAILKNKYNILSIPHGDFMSITEPEKGWLPLGPQPRYISNYIGLRNRLGILNENYPYADFKTRIDHCHKLFHSFLEYCAQNRAKIKSLIQDADRDTIRRGISPGEKDRFGTAFDVRPLEKNITVHGYVMEMYETESGRRRARKTEEKRTYTMPLFSDYFPVKSVRLPYAYLIPMNIPEVRDKLLQHGIAVEQLLKPAKLAVETFIIEKLTSQPLAYQGHHLNQVQGKYVEKEIEFPVGSLFVGLAQPLANVISYLLEPESDDGLLVWNFFDRYIIPQWGRGTQIYPVYRLLDPVFLSKISY